MQANESYETYRPFMDTRPPVVLANIAICLIHQTNYLLDQLVRRLETDFVQKGGLRERITSARLHHRESRDQSMTRRRKTDSN
jgi:four helix bundle suffix protein